MTLANLADLARGLAGGNYTIPQEGSSRKRKAEPAKGQLDVVALTGAKVDLNKEVRVGPDRENTTLTRSGHRSTAHPHDLARLSARL